MEENFGDKNKYGLSLVVKTRYRAGSALVIQLNDCSCHGRGLLFFKPQFPHLRDGGWVQY